MIPRLFVRQGVDDGQWQTTMHEIALWFDQPTGSQWLAQEQQLLARVLGKRCFGRYLLHYGPQSGTPISLPDLEHCIRLGPALPGVAIHCTEQAWPIAEQSVDAVVLQHALDSSASPKALLQEAARAVRAGGHLLIIGINPLSLWGMQCLFSRGALRHLGSLRPAKVSRWLKHLGFMLELHCYGGYCASSPRALGSGRYRMPVGGFYLLVARKLMMGVRPWRKERRERLNGRLIPLTFRIGRRASLRPMTKKIL